MTGKISVLVVEDEALVAIHAASCQSDKQDKATQTGSSRNAPCNGAQLMSNVCNPTLPSDHQRNRTTRYASAKLTITAKDIVSASVCMAAERAAHEHGSSRGLVTVNPAPHPP